MIYFVRHGETDFNKFQVSQGQLDTSLNYQGLKEAQAVAEKLKDYKFDIIFCSPLIRAKQTLEYILKYHKLTPIFDDRLKEVSRGILQGSKHSQEVYDEFFKDPHKFGAETQEDVCVRAKSFLDYLQQYKGKDILVVGHGEFWRHFLYVFSGDYEKGKPFPIYGQENYFVIKNCDVATIDF